MTAIDWGVLVVYLTWLVWDGLRRSKNTDKVEGYFLASRSLPWWAVGLSVMATQMSAITIVWTISSCRTSSCARKAPTLTIVSTSAPNAVVDGQRSKAAPPNSNRAVK